MSKETIQMVYKPVDLVTPEQAKRLGIVTDKPTFLAPEFMIRNDLALSLVYEVGTIVEAQKSPRERIFAFPDLKTALMYESVGYFGFVPYTGFIAIGEAVSDYVIEPIAAGLRDNCILLEKIRILGIKAFVKEVEVKHGYVGEFIDTYNQVSILVIDNDGRLTRGRARYIFRITERGEVLFNEPKEPTNLQEIIDAIRRGEIVKITQPVSGLTHPLTRPNGVYRGYVSLEKLTKEQVMQMYQEMEARRENDIS